MLYVCIRWYTYENACTHVSYDLNLNIFDMYLFDVICTCDLMITSTLSILYVTHICDLVITCILTILYVILICSSMYSFNVWLIPLIYISELDLLN